MGIWAASLRGVAPDMIKRGLSKLVELRLEWPPSAPQFAGLCHPSAEDLGIPEQDAVWSEISHYRRNKRYRPSPFAYALFMDVGRALYEIDRLPTEKHRKRVATYYKALVKRVMDGEELQDAPVLVESKKPDNKPSSKEHAAKQIEKLRAMLSVGGVSNE